jgi:hypothetical protein
LQPLPSFGAAVVVEQAVHVACEGVRAFDWEELKPYFRLIAIVCDVKGDVPGGQEARTDAALTALAAAMASQKRYFRATETGIDHWSKLAKKRPLVAAWMADPAHRPAWEWMLTWLLEHERAPPMPYAGSTRAGLAHDEASTIMRPLKRAAGGYSTYPYSNYNAQRGAGEREACLVPNLRRLAAGRPPQYESYESDDEPDDIVGRRCSVNVGHGRGWVPGVITSCDRATNFPGQWEHVVQFDGVGAGPQGRSSESYVFRRNAVVGAPAVGLKLLQEPSPEELVRGDVRTVFYLLTHACVVLGRCTAGGGGGGACRGGGGGAATRGGAGGGAHRAGRHARGRRGPRRRARHRPHARAQRRLVLIQRAPEPQPPARCRQQAGGRGGGGGDGRRCRPWHWPRAYRDRHGHGGGVH